MTKTVLGVFTERKDAEEAISTLEAEGYNPKELSIVMKDTTEGSEIAKDTGAKTAGGAVSGATAGAVLGGLAGILSSTVIPGLGALFIGGPIAAALGLTGAAAATVSGATTGAVAGGLLGALTGFGLSESEAKTYEQRVREGAILLVVPAQGITSDRVEEILADCEAEDVKTVSNRGTISVEPLDDMEADEHYFGEIARR